MVKSFNIHESEKHRIDNAYNIQKKKIRMYLTELEINLLKLNLNLDDIKQILDETEDKLIKNLISELKNLTIIKWEPNNEI